MKEHLIEECMICFEETNHFSVFPCKHYVCKECYEQLLEHHPQCPLCNYPLQQKWFQKVCTCFKCRGILCYFFI